MMGLMGKHLLITGYLRGLVGLCKAYYGMLKCDVVLRFKDKERCKS